MTASENRHILKDPAAPSSWNGNGRREMGRGPAIRIRDEHGIIRAENIPNVIPVRFHTNNIRAGETKPGNVADKIDSVRNIYKIVIRISSADSERPIYFKTTDL